MKKYKLGIDLDNVIVDTNNFISSYLNRKYGTNYGYNDIKTSKPFHEHITNPDEFFSNNRFIFRKAPSVYGAREGLEYLSKNNDIYIITARKDVNNIKEDTLYWLRTFNIPYKDIIFNAGNKKGKICKQLDIPIFIDDCHYELEDIIQNDILGLLFTRPWNKDLEYYNRLNDWNDIIKQLGDKNENIC